MYPMGFEPMTYRLKGDCSTGLSYGYKTQVTIPLNSSTATCKEKRYEKSPILTNNEYFIMTTNTPSGCLYKRNNIQPLPK